MVMRSEGRLTPTREASELAQSVHAMIRVLLGQLRPAVESEGLSKGQFMAMHLLSGMEAASVNDAAKHLAVTAPSMCVTVDQLEEMGLVARRRSAKDRRTVEVSLTPKGRRVEARVWARIELQLAEALSGLPGAEIATTARTIRELTQRLDQAGPGGARV